MFLEINGMLNKMFLEINGMLNCSDQYPYFLSLFLFLLQNLNAFTWNPNPSLPCLLRFDFPSHWLGYGIGRMRKFFFLQNEAILHEFGLV